MASTIQVDKIQDTGGNTILSSNSTGTFTYEAASGANFTALDADNISAGTLAAARGGTGGASGGGKVLQVVNTLATINSSTTSGSYADIGLSRTITCAATTSKVLVIATVPCKNYNAVQCEAQFQMLRDLTTLGTQYVGYGAMGSDDVLLDSVAFTYLDSPSSTSELTFKVQAKRAAGSGTVQYGFGVSNGCSLTCMEIGA